MNLPPTLQWIEVDFQDIIAYKEETLANEEPRCRLERISLDLSDGPERRKLFAQLNARATKVVVATEGLLIYSQPRKWPPWLADLCLPRTAFRPGSSTWLPWPTPIDAAHEPASN